MQNKLKKLMHTADYYMQCNVLLSMYENVFNR